MRKKTSMDKSYSKWDSFVGEEEEKEVADEKPKGVALLESKKGTSLAKSFLKSADLESPSAWARGLHPEEQQEWLCDCYGLRVVDRSKKFEQVGVLDKNATVVSILRHFLAFCILARRSGAIPKDWDWENFLLKVCLKEIPFPVDPADERFEKEKDIMLLGSRSMRLTASAIYVAAPGDPSPLERNALRHCRLAFLEEEEKAQIDLFSPLGGKDLWMDFYEKFLQDPGPNVLGGTIIPPDMELPPQDPKDVDATAFVVTSQNNQENLDLARELKLLSF